MNNRKVEVRICDFDISKKLRTQQETPNEHFVGTEKRAASESISGEAWTTKAEMWTAGAIRFSLVTGLEPFRNARGHNSTRLLQIRSALS